MMKRFHLLCLLILMTGCGSSGTYSIAISHNNLSNAYVYPYHLSINDEGGFPAGLIGCSNGVNTASLARVHLKNRPQFVIAEWENVLSGKYYHAKVPLDERTGQWLRHPPFGHAADGVALIVQWRGDKRVAVMLVADFTDFSKGKMDIGEAVGEEMPTPENPPRITPYKELRQVPGNEYYAGEITSYERTRDDTLSRQQRFGCPRKANGSVDEKRLPPAKLPFLTGADGEYIPCDAYFCTDKQALIKKLETIGWRNYPPDSTPPEITFRDAPNPEPAW